MKRFTIAALFVAIVAAPATAQLTWFADRASFEAANSGNILAGIEDYEASTLPPNSVDRFGDPLQFGVPTPNGPYPNGSQGLMNLTTQTNTLGANPTVPSPAGAIGPVAGSDGFLGLVSDNVLAGTFSSGLDLIFDGGNVAVGGNVTDLLGSQTGVNIQIYDTANNFLGESLVPGNAAGTSFTGVISGGAAIGRVNLFSTGNGAEGMDNVQAWVQGGPCDPCDMNCDGTVDAIDIEFFIDILFNGATPCDTCTGDTNGDGVVNAEDIEGFINCLFP